MNENTPAKQYDQGFIFNDDCVEVLKDLPEESIDLILTDPPYGVNFKNDFYDDSVDSVLKSMPTWFEQWYRLLKQDSYLLLYVGVKTLHLWMQAGIDTGFQLKNVVATRAFNNGMANSKNNFGFQFQPVIVFSKGAGKKFNEVDFVPTSKEWFRDKRNKNPKEFTYQYPNWIEPEWSFATVKSDKKNLHPNEKNVKLLKFFIELTTNPNDIVLDCFGGSGSTAVACIESGRKFITIEKDANYFNVIKGRIDGVLLSN